MSAADLPVHHVPAGARIRRIRPADLDALACFYAGLSPDSRRLRFFSAGSGLAADAASGFCHPDHAHEEGFVALVAGRIVGHLCLEPTDDGALEMAIAVADALQGRGLGRRLLGTATAWARHHGYLRLKATILADNVPMLRLLHAIDGRVELGPPQAGVIAATVELTAERMAGAVA
ncbi:MAG: N-acetyltransferase family protein [Candidatus Limnocylindrales bacterium]